MGLRARRSPVSADGLGGPSYKTANYAREPYSSQADADVAAVCQQEGRVLVTLDLDFADIRAYPLADYLGIVVLLLARLDKRRVLSIMQRLMTLVERGPLAGKPWIVDESSVRVRG